MLHLPSMTARPKAPAELGTSSTAQSLSTRVSTAETILAFGSFGWRLRLRKLRKLHRAACARTSHSSHSSARHAMAAMPSAHPGRLGGEAQRPANGKAAGRTSVRSGPGKPNHNTAIKPRQYCACVKPKPDHAQSKQVTARALRKNLNRKQIPDQSAQEGMLVPNLSMAFCLLAHLCLDTLVPRMYIKHTGAF